MGNTPVYIGGILDDIMEVPVMPSVRETPLNTKEGLYSALRAL